VDLIVNGLETRLIGEVGGDCPCTRPASSGFGSALVSPIDIDGGRSGIVVVGRTDRDSFQSADRTLLTSMTDSLVIALKNADNRPWS